MKKNLKTLQLVDQDMDYGYKGVCAVCGKENYVVTVASRYGCYSHSLCKECLRKGREPYLDMVSYIACAGHFPNDINAAYQEDVRRQLAMYGISEEQFIKDVDKEIENQEIALDYWLGADLDECIDM